MRIAIRTGDLFKRLSPKEACTAIRDAGFDAVDWTIDAQMDLASLEEQAKTLEESGLAIAQASLFKPLFDPNGDTQPIERAHALIALCGSVRCPYLIVPPISRQKEYGLGMDEIYARNLDTYGALADVASACGVTICLENSLVDWRGYPYAGACTYPEEAASLVDALNERAGQTLFGVCLNTGHLDLARSDFFSYLYKLGNRIKTLHVNDNHGVYDDRILPMTGGVIAWNYVCRALRQNGYRGDVVLDASFADYDNDMLTSALSLAADCARVLCRRIGEV